MSLDALAVEKDHVAFVWFNNYSGVTLRTPTKTLVVDPANVDPRVFKTVDAVLVTHEHYDHFDQGIIQNIHKRTLCSVVADPTSAKRLGDVITSDKLHEMRMGKEISFGNVTIRGEGFKHPAAAPVSYLITTEDGVRVYHTGDSLPLPDMKQIGERSPADLVFCTVGAPAPGASPQSGLEIVRMVKAKAAVPYHAPAADRKRLAELIAKEMPDVKCIVVEQNKPVMYP